MKRNLNLFIEDISENINLINNSTKNMSQKEFILNKDIIDAIIRRLEVIGEAAKNLPDSFRDKYPKVPWKDISWFRDVLIHGYFGINLDRIWKVIKEDLPELKKEIKDILKKEK